MRSRASASVRFTRSASSVAPGYAPRGATPSRSSSASANVRAVRPYIIAYGEWPVDALTAVLCASCMDGSSVSQSDCAASTEARSAPISVLLATSVWPSVCGWKAVLRRSCVTNMSHSPSQKRDVKRVSRSLMSATGTPCTATTCR